MKMKKTLSAACVLFLLFASIGYANPIGLWNLFAEKNKESNEEITYTWNGKKYACDAPSMLFFPTKEIAKELCGLCSNRKIKKKKAKNFEIYNGKRYDTKRFFMDNRDYALLPNSTIHACVSKSIKECPADKPLLDNYGFCHSCDDIKGVDVSWNVGDEENREKQLNLVNEACAVCPNREVKNIYSDWDEHLGYFCVLKKCPKDNPLKDNLGGCRSCDDMEKIQLDEDLNAEYIRLNNERFMKKFREYSFDSSENSLEDEKEEDYCSVENISEPVIQDEICPNRFIDDDHEVVFPIGLKIYSILKKCPPDMPLRDKYGICHSCDEEDYILVSEKRAFLGKIKCGKVYNKDLQLVGHVGNNFSKKTKTEYDGERRRPEELIEEDEIIYDMENNIVGRIKSGFEYCFIYGTNDSMSGSDHSIVAIGIKDKGESKFKSDCDGTYFPEVSPDEFCPNREVIYTGTKGDKSYYPPVFVSRLKQ